MPKVTANNLDQAIPSLNQIFKGTKSKWRKLGDQVANWIREDLVDGELQGEKRADTYRSEQYKKYKRNEMRRYTVGETQGFNRAGDVIFINRSTKKAGRNKKLNRTTGKRLKAYYGKRIKSTETSFVNLTLTGNMTNSLKPRQYDDFGVDIGVDAEHTGKVLGNRKLGREFLTLNEANTKRASEIVLNEIIDPSLKTLFKDKIVIEVKI